MESIRAARLLALALGGTCLSACQDRVTARAMRRYLTVLARDCRKAGLDPDRLLADAGKSMPKVKFTGPPEKPAPLVVIAKS